jgi:hypothetical protein
MQEKEKKEAVEKEAVGKKQLRTRMQPRTACV